MFPQQMSSTTEHGSRAPWDLPQPASTAAVHGTVTGSAQEVDSACRQLDFHRIGLSQAIREIDSLDAVMDCLSTKSCAFEDADCQTEGVVLSPSLSRLLAMAEQEIGKPTRRPDKGSGVQMQDAEVMTSQRHVLDLQQQLEGARQREQDRAMSLAAVLRRANEEVQGLKEGSELLAVTLCQRNEEVASLQTGLAECEREIRNISALLLEALRNAVVGLPQKADTAASMPEPAKLALVKIPSHPKQEETIKYSPGGRRNHSGGSGHSLDVIGWLADGSDTETVLRHSGDDSDRAGAASEALAQQRPADLPPETHASVLPPVVGIFSWQQRRAFPKHEGRQATPWRAPGHSSSSPDSARNYKPPPGMTYIEMITEIAAAFKDDAPHAQPGEEVPHDIPSHGAVPLGSEDDGHPQSVPCEGETRGPGVAAESCGKELSDAGENELAASPLPKSIEEFVKEMYEVPQSEGSSSGQAKQQGSSPDGQPMQGEQGQRKPRQHKLKFWVPPMQLLRIPRPGCSYTEQFAIRSQAEARISAYLAQRGQSQRKPNPDQPITARLFRTRKQTPFSSSKIRMRHAHNSLASTSQHRQQSAGVLFAGDAWHKAVHVASKSRHPCPGGEAAPLVASWDCSALPPVPAASRNPARLQRSLSMLGVSKEALPTPDALGMQRASVPRVRRSPSKEQPRISDNETGAGVDLAARLLRQQRAIETMADKSSSGGSLDIEAPQQSKAENRPSPDEERNAGDVHPVFEVQVYCSLDPKVSAQGYESRPLAWEFSRWKHACGWASTGFVVLREVCADPVG